MIKLLELGDYYLSDFVEKGDEHLERKKYSLDLILDEEIGAARLKEVAPYSAMYGKYWYRSGTNMSMTLELKSIVEEISSRVKLKEGDIWLDIACNDGTLLKFVPRNIITVGIDPANDEYYKESSQIADVVVQDFFSYKAWQTTKFGEDKAKIITTIAMFYDLDDPNPFIEDINKVLDDDGVWVIQLSYTPLMLHQLAFDNICHEHIYYYSLTSLQKLFTKHDLKIVDASLNDTNGGSIRVYIQKNRAKSDSFGTSPLRDVCQFRIESLNLLEVKWDISNPIIWEQFHEKIELLKSLTTTYIKKKKEQGSIICGYGASTKGNTLLQYFGLDHTLIDAIAERSPYKYGLKTIGTNIPIHSEQIIRNMNPDYMLVLPWHFIKEFCEREKKYLDKGGKFIVPCPRFQIIGNE